MKIFNPFVLYQKNIQFTKYVVYAIQIFKFVYSKITVQSSLITSVMERVRMY
jgi:hypothetical protein